jgi:hypothetical protein
MTTYDAESDVAAATVGSGILLTQAFALFPGLLPCLLLTLPLVLPLVVLGLVGAILVGVPLGIWRLTARLVGARHREAAPTAERRPQWPSTHLEHHPGWSSRPRIPTPQPPSAAR